MNARGLFSREFPYTADQPWKEDLFAQTLALYLFTLFLQIIAAEARWYLTLVLATIASWLFVEPLDPHLVANIVGYGPLIWSVTTFWWPGKGESWRKVIGADEPSPEAMGLVKIAARKLGPEAMHLISGVEVYIFNSQDLFAFSRGRALVISQGLLDSPFLAAVLAHELSHFRTWDALLTQALSRLVLWVDPYRHDEKCGERSPKQLAFLKRWYFRVAGGYLMLNLWPLRGLWASNLRKREAIADAYAVKCGQGFNLAELLELCEKHREVPNPHWLVDMRLHLPVQHRISNLREMALRQRVSPHSSPSFEEYKPPPLSGAAQEEADDQGDADNRSP